MPKIKANGIELYYEEAGRGTPLVFLHEFGGDHRSWEPQLRFFARRYRAVTFSARGYLPSEVPDDPEAYDRLIAVADVIGLMDALGIEKAHLCGLSMGSFTALWLGLAHPERALSLTIAGSGYGSGPEREHWQQSVNDLAEVFLKEGLGERARAYGAGSARVQFQNKDPRGFAEYLEQFLGHSATGSAYTFQRIQARRPSLMDFGEQMQKLTLPVLIMLGDEDPQGLPGSLFMKENIPRAGLEMFPKAGHLLNLEEPARFNRSLLDFITAVEAGRWEPRDPRSRGG